MYMFSNSETALRFDEDQDKLLVIETPEKGLGDAFYKALADGDMKDKHFLSAFYWFVMNRDVSKFQYGSLPVRTDAMRAMAAATTEDSAAALKDALESNLGATFSKKVLTQEDIRNWLKQNSYKVNSTQIKSVVASSEWQYYRGRKIVNGRRVQPCFIARPEEVGQGKSAAELYAYFKANVGPF